MIAVMVAEPISDPVEHAQPGLRPFDHRNGNRPIEHHHGIARHVLQTGVKRFDRRPVGVGGDKCLIVDCGNRRLQLVLADSVLFECPGDEGDAFTDEGPDPIGCGLGGGVGRASRHRRSGQDVGHQSRA